ncbi:NRDE family protein [Ralstonia pickettii]|nr:NRDE family protein [Ralstonia pickettii]
MCLINFHIQKHSNYKLIVAANRDEFYARPTEKAHFWPDAPALLAGRDLVQKGTWLGITKEGRFAALTNIRDLSLEGKDKKSRGKIVSEFLNSSVSPTAYLGKISTERNDYAGFNILLGNAEQLFHYNNVEDRITEVIPGTHSLSNDSLNTPWPKVQKGRDRLRAYIMEQQKLDPNKLFTIMENKEIAPDSELPQTGIGIELERSLSASFIKTPDYGTRSSTVLLIDSNNHVIFIERTYENGSFKAEQVFNFSLQPSS